VRPTDAGPGIIGTVDDPPELTCIRRSPLRGPIDEASLVLTARGIDNHVEREAGGDWCLYVAPVPAAFAERELERYRFENRPRPAPRVVPIDSGWAGALGYLFVIWLLPTLEGRGTFGWQWRDAGAMVAGRVVDGEWWRTITALTLHADLGHLIANSVFGVVFGLLLGRYLGSGVGWLVVVASAGVANAIDALIQADDFRSIGASTATFAALAVSAAFAWRRGYYQGRGWRRSLAPVFGAFALLAFTGVGSEHVDIVAHFAGFACGTLAGIVCAGIAPEGLRPRVQALAGVVALVLVAGAWLLAGIGAG